MDAIKTVVIVGGVAGGASAAARLRRLDESIDIVVLERSGYVSFANCGLPYHLSGTIADRSDLLLQTPQSLRERFSLDVRVRSEVRSIDRARKTVSVHDITEGTTYEQHYDALILSPGATPLVPPIVGAERGFVLRDIEDLDRIMQRAGSATNAVVVGGGFIGLEAAENLRESGLNVTLVERDDQLLAPVDAEMAWPLEAELFANAVSIELGHEISAVDDGFVTLDDGRHIDADIVLFAIGVKPDVGLAVGCDLRIGECGGIAVNDNQRTNDHHIWAVGDATEKSDLLFGGSMLAPLANIANRQGRRAADDILGHTKSVQPTQATAIVKVFGLSAAVTGWNEKKLFASGRRYISIHTHPSDHAAYFPGSAPMALKVLIDPSDGSILGAQAVGRNGVDKRIDVLATAMRAGLKATDLADLELAYAPPYGSAKDPINQIGYIAENRLSGLSPAIDHSEITRFTAAGWKILDVRTAEEFSEGAIPHSANVPVDELRQRIGELRGNRFIVVCKVGQRAHVAVRLLHEHGIEAVALDGGWTTWCHALAS